MAAIDQNAHLRSWVREYLENNDVTSDEAIRAYADEFPDRTQALFDSAIANISGYQSTEIITLTQTEALEALESHIRLKRERAYNTVHSRKSRIAQVAQAKSHFDAAKVALTPLMDNVVVAGALKEVGRDITEAKAWAISTADFCDEQEKIIEQYDKSLKELRAIRLSITHDKNVR